MSISMLVLYTWKQLPNFFVKPHPALVLHADEKKGNCVGVVTPVAILVYRYFKQKRHIVLINSDRKGPDSYQSHQFEDLEVARILSTFALVYVHCFVELVRDILGFFGGRSRSSGFDGRHLTALDWLPWQPLAQVAGVPDAVALMSSLEWRFNLIAIDRTSIRLEIHFRN